MNFFVLIWLMILFYFYYLDPTHARKIFSILLLITPVIIILLDRPNIFLEIANAILDTVGYLIILIYEQIDKFLESRRTEPKYKCKVQRRDQLKKWLRH
ncbi:hypothetical protein [Virgibacillus halodenitrificans]|uniref:hypothetical protein n=1 Tax=Virgibacillus halodenitrificans TaxID=1482 RepID=UPI0013CF024F|nr:hypothetical protein [Virgibacillus halodenitrificans]